jgi:V8-like Glu-specific endopeptidase
MFSSFSQKQNVIHYFAVIFSISVLVLALTLPTFVMAEESAPDAAYGAVNPDYKPSDSPLLRIPDDKLNWRPIVPPEPREVEGMEDPTAVEIYEVATGEVTVIPSDDFTQQPAIEDLTSTPSYPGLLPAGIPQESVIGTDDRQRISPTTSYPWRTVCKLFITAGDDTHWIGSGVIIGRLDNNAFHIYTAGHCVYIHNHGGWVKHVEVIPGYDNGYMPYNHAWGTYLRTYTGWTNNADHRHDWAVVTLDRRVGNFTGWMGRMTAPSSDPVYTTTLNAAGYPGDLMGGEGLYWDSDSGHYADDYNHWYYMDTAGGQSGGPVWVYYSSSGNRYILTIHAYGVYGSYTSNHGTRLNNDKFDRTITWIDSDTPPTDKADLIDDGQAYSGCSPGTIKPGSTFQAYCDVRNIGTASSGIFNVS